MSTNCLVTQLKGTVTMNDPVYFNKIQFSVAQNVSPTENNNWIAIGTDESSVKLKALNGATFGNVYDVTDTYTEEDITKTYPARGNKYPANTEGEVSFELIGKSHLKQFGGDLIQMNLRHLTGCNLYWIMIRNNNGLTGDISVFKFMSNLNYVNLRNCRYIVGDLSVFSDKTSLTTLEVDTGYNQHGIYGNISSLSNLTLLESLRLYGNNIVGTLSALGKLTSLNTLLLSATNVEGSLEDFVVAQRNNGRITESTGIRLDWLGSKEKITFNGSPIANADNKKLTWTETTITYDGVTITA